MKRICILLVMFGLAARGADAQAVPGIGVIPVPVVVNCDQGQSLNSTLSRLERRSPLSVLVNGTCTEYVQINGFEGLTLKGLPGATLQQPSTDPSNGLLIQVLSIAASRSVTIDGFAIHSRASALDDIGIGQNSIDVRLRNLTVDGASGFGIFVFESSQVSLAHVTARDPGFATVGVVDISDVHIESSLFENSQQARPSMRACLSRQDTSPCKPPPFATCSTASTSREAGALIYKALTPISQSARQPMW